MATNDEILKRVRKELGDLGEPFRASYDGDGSSQVFRLPVQHVALSGLTVFTITGTVIVNLATPTNFTLDADNGVLSLTAAIQAGTVLVVQGVSYGLFSDTEINEFVSDAVLQHTSGRTITTRYREDGFIRYREDPISLVNLPEVENLLVSLLATIEALWALSTDASTDIDVITAEGTHLPRSQRWAQLIRQIDVLTEKYKGLCEQLNVGLSRIEVSTLRRTSLQTGRLVPVFESREYDDNTRPKRLLPPIDHRHDDESGIPSPISGSGW